jgi:two-component system sensor histidine kinase/response regulator
MQNLDIYHLLLDESSDPIFSFYPDGTYRYVNNAFAGPFGKTPKDIIGKKIWDIFPQDEADKRFAVVKKVFGTGEEVSFEVRVPQPALDKYYLTTVKPIKNDAGEVITIICISKEITERRRIEEELKHKNEELSALNATKDKFFMIVAHDLKNPLGNFRDITRLMRDSYSEFTNTEKRHFLDLMVRSANNLYSFFETLLLWSNSQRGIIPFYPVVIPIKTMVDDVFKSLASQSDAKKLSLINIIPDSIFITADPNMINTILKNLISNSIKFTRDEGQISVNISEAEDIITFSVADTGVGIKKEIHDKLFKIESNVTTPGTNKEKGMGLGLVICKEFVKKHEGEIWFETKTGKGTTFFFTIKNQKNG